MDYIIPDKLNYLDDSISDIEKYFIIFFYIV